MENNFNTICEIISSSFAERFGADAQLFAAPGRINLIGEHTDYNGGFVFPGAVTQSIVTAIKPNGSRDVHLFAVDLDMEYTINLDDEQGPTDINQRYVYGVCREMMAHGVHVEGFDAVYGGNVPLGAGMSSSAALECCFAKALSYLFANDSIDSMTLAKIGQATEHKYVGVKCGIMDQFISMHGREGSLVRLDCRSGEFEYYPWHPKDYRLVLVNSLVHHELVGSPYNERRESCERVAAAAGVETLRDFTMERLDAMRPSLDATDYQRALYVLGEEQRVRKVCEALQQDDYETVGQQMYLTHEGLSKNYEVSCEEIDFLVDTARRCGVTGSRIMGGGFGGCTINLVKDSLYDQFISTAQSSYEQKFGLTPQIIPVLIGPGARRIK